MTRHGRSREEFLGPGEAREELRSLDSATRSAPLRIAIVATSYAPWLLGGAEHSLRELCEDLITAGHEVRVLALGPRRDRVTHNALNGVDVIRFGAKAFFPFENGGKNASVLAKLRFHLGELARFSTHRFLRRELKQFGPDVVHLNNIAGMGWLAWRAARLYPSVQTLRDYYLCCLNTTANHGGATCQASLTPCRIARSPFRRKHDRPTLFVGVSDRTVKILRLQGALVASDPSITIYNEPRLKLGNVGTAKAGGGEEPLTFGMIGRVGKDKGTWLGLEAFYEARATLGTRLIRLVIAGTGIDEDVDSLRSAAMNDSGVDYIGPVDASDFLRRVDVVLVPTQWEEPFGRSAAEALDAGRTLLASRTGGLPEVVLKHGGNAMLIDDFRDRAAWCNAIVSVASTRPPLIPAVRAHTIPVSSQYVGAYQWAIETFWGVGKRD
jgi:glycogen(starch) synthase